MAIMVFSEYHCDIRLDVRTGSWYSRVPMLEPRTMSLEEHTRGRYTKSGPSHYKDCPDCSLPHQRYMNLAVYL